MPIGTQDAGLLDADATIRATPMRRCSPMTTTRHGDDALPPRSPLAHARRTSGTGRRDLRAVRRPRSKRRFKWLRADAVRAAAWRTTCGPIAGTAGRARHVRRMGPGARRQAGKLVDLLQTRASHARRCSSSPSSPTPCDTWPTQLRSARRRRAWRASPATRDDPTAAAWRFSPSATASAGWFRRSDELRVLVATDVLSEGQNLQDCAIVVNYDLPWAIIRLIQRAGRVDRIGQQAETILCYSFLPAEGSSASSACARACASACVRTPRWWAPTKPSSTTTRTTRPCRDLYHREVGHPRRRRRHRESTSPPMPIRSGRTPLDRDPQLGKEDHGAARRGLFDASATSPTPACPRAPGLPRARREDNDALAGWTSGARASPIAARDSQGGRVRARHAAPCRRLDNHHELVQAAVELIAGEKQAGGGLGRPRGARFRTYERLKSFADDRSVHNRCSTLAELHRAIDEIYRLPLAQRGRGPDQPAAPLQRHLRRRPGPPRSRSPPRRAGSASLREDEPDPEPRIICSLGLKRP